MKNARLDMPVPQYLRPFDGSWTDRAIVQQVIAQITISKGQYVFDFVTLLDAATRKYG